MINLRRLKIPVGSQVLRGIPFKSSALHYSRVPAVDGEMLDKTVTVARPSAPPRVWDGNGSAKLRFADFPSETVTYYDNVLGSEQTGSTDVNGDFTLPTNQVTYIKISTYIWNPSEITDSSSNNQGEFYDESGTYKAQVFNSYHTAQTDSWAEQDARGLAVCDAKGYTLAKALGKNLFNGPAIRNGKLDGTLTATSVIFSGDSVIASGTSSFIVGSYAYLEKNTDYFFSVDSIPANSRYYVYDTDGNIVVNYAEFNTSFNSGDHNILYVALFSTSGTDITWLNLQLEQGTTATTYEAWEGIYKDSALAIPYEDGQTIQALRNADGSYSTQYAKGYVSDGEGGSEHVALEYVGRCKHTLYKTDVAGAVVTTGDITTSDYCKMMDSEGKIWPLIYQSDVDNDTFYDDTDPQVPTVKNNAVTVFSTSPNIADQTFSKFDGTTLKELAHYEEPQTGDALARIKSYFGIA